MAFFDLVQIMRTALGRANGRHQQAAFSPFFCTCFHIPAFLSAKGGWPPTYSFKWHPCHLASHQVSAQEALVQQVMGREVRNVFPLLTHSFLQAMVLAVGTPSKGHSSCQTSLLLLAEGPGNFHLFFYSFS